MSLGRLGMTDKKPGTPYGRRMTEVLGAGTMSLGRLGMTDNKPGTFSTILVLTSL
jgi:hypothetical protein